MLATIEKVLFLQSVVLLGEVPTDALAHLAVLSTESELAAHVRLWRVGDPAEAVYFVVEGEVLLREGAHKVGVARPGADLGTAALLIPDAPRPTSAITTAPTLLLRLAHVDFYEVLSEHPRLAQAILVALGRRLRPDGLYLEAEDSRR